MSHARYLTLDVLHEIFYIGYLVLGTPYYIFRLDASDYIFHTALSTLKMKNFYLLQKLVIHINNVFDM